MANLEERDAIFGVSRDANGEYDMTQVFDRKQTMFVWTGDGNPFTKDEVGQRMMRYFVLVQQWEGDNLAESLFSAIGMRVVDVLHASDVDDE